jgi:hypothetical protein
MSAALLGHLRRLAAVQTEMKNRIDAARAAIDAYGGPTDPAELPELYREGNILDHVRALLEAPHG